MSTTKLPAVITAFTAGNAANQFDGHVNAPPTQPDAPETRWRGKYDLQPPHVAKRRLVNGYKVTGDPEIFRLLAWENPSKPGQFSVGMLMETFAYGRQMQGVPQAVQLWLHSNHESYEEAVRLCETLALNNVFGGLKKLIDEGGDKYLRLSTDTGDMPFASPTHWKKAQMVCAVLSHP